MRHLKQLVLAIAGTAAVLGLAAPAAAADNLTLIESSSACTLGFTGAAACQGYYGGNLSGSTVSVQQTALNALLNSPTVGVAIGGSAPVINWTALTNSGALLSQVNLSGNVLNFGTTLFGQNLIGVHFGNNSDPANPPPNVSAFYRFDFGNTGASSITFAPNASGFSNAVLYTATSGAVPEPATWAMMLLGFGIMGAGMKTRRRPATLQQLA